MPVQVKICGITSAEAADAAVRAGADFVGLNLHPASPRYLRADAARALAERMRGRVRLAIVLSDPADEAIAQAVAAVKPDIIQLHGRESRERVAEVRGRFGVEVMKAFPIAEASDLAQVPAYEAVADMLMFDAKPPKGAAYSGGHGSAFDWQLLRGRKFMRPWMLAGGLNPENVARAIATSGAEIVDVSSGVETAPGQKSASLIADFVANARSSQFVSPPPLAGGGWGVG
jgi:phosphoribosylanthranilate isomerase